jgi:hypothetical protein
MTNNDHYAEAKALAAALSEQGRQAEATRILDAMGNRTTGSEICMTLRFEVAALASRSDLSSEMRRRLATLQGWLEHLLR